MYTLNQDLIINYKKTTPYYTQVNGMMESFNDIIEHDLTKAYNVNPHNCDQRALVVLWAYNIIEI